jgi:hypothetical protein
MEAAEGKALNHSAVIPFTAAEKPASQAKGGYQAVRFNAMKHGILSSLVVLAHEDGGDFDDMLAALIEEHRPAGMTEQHLIEELAAIIWRKRRVLMAEAARINEGLKATVNNAKSVMASAAPFQPGLSAENGELQDLMTETPEQIAETQRDAELDLARRPARRLRSLRKGGPACLRQSPAGAAARLARLLAGTDRGRGTPGDRGRAGAASSVNRSTCRAGGRRWKPDTPRRSRRKPWAKGCGRTCWRS